MRFQGTPHYSHATPSKVGVLVTNLGTPQAATAKALRPYLKQFLWDPRVVEVPRPIWWMILNGIILNIRPKRSAKAYQEVWTERGSPLLFHTQDQSDKLRTALQAQYGKHIVVEFAMRYGQPSIDSALDKLAAAGVNKLIVLPLYPQYSAATTGSTFDAVADNFKQRRWLPDLRFISQYTDNEHYINALAETITAHREKNGPADKVVFSYHGMPQRYLDQGDPYHCLCHKTTRLIVEKLGLKDGEYLTSFQSRFGREPWLQPYTDETLKNLPSQGVKSIQVICPGFSSDCLETIEEIGGENREYFMEAGGERYEYIECLNASDAHIAMMKNLVETQARDWLTPALEDPIATQARALNMGAKA